jgi:signal recognition particle subunit SRP19
MKGERILYPCYFNAALQRSEGRRVPRPLAIPDPTLVDVERAVKKLGLSYHTEVKQHPAYWMKQIGRTAVMWKGSKEELLKKVARKMEKRR